MLNYFANAPLDIRLNAARYYDYSPTAPNDIPFYADRIDSPNTKVLELGCGTGRVTISLSKHCKFIHGIDASDAMLSICREKIEKEGVSPEKIKIETGDITKLKLKEKFDLIIAPFRVIQNVESDEDVLKLFGVIREHLSPNGTCILNVFNPNRDRETLIREWCDEGETLHWEAALDDGKVACYDRKPRMDKEKLILYPELIYRKYKEGVLIDEAVLKIAMRCYYPEEFTSLIEANGFKIKNKWGGYAGEVYGQGPELIVEFES